MSYLTQCVERFLGIIGRYLVFPSPTCCDISSFYYYIGAYSIDSSKMMGNFFQSLELQTVICETRPVHP